MSRFFPSIFLRNVKPVPRDQLLSMGYFSQLGQDLFLHRLFGERSGYFVDIGAHDGQTFSNSLFFERNQNWQGICIEANPTVFKDLERNRECLTLNVAVGPEAGNVNFTSIQGYSEMLSGIDSSYHPRHRKRIRAELKKFGGKLETLSVPALPLREIFARERISQADFLSIDIEGGELQALKSINFDEFRAKVLVIENNYGATQTVSFLRRKGYLPIIRLGHDTIFFGPELTALAD